MDLKFKKIDTKNLDENLFKQLIDVETNSGGEPYSKDELKEVLCWESSSTFVCFDKDVAVGMVTINGNSKKFGGSIYIVNASVKNDYHRLGIATRLFYEAYKFYNEVARESVVSISVDKTNEPAVKLYQKVGFNMVEDYDDDEQYGMILPLKDFGNNLEKILNLKNKSESK